MLKLIVYNESIGKNYIIEWNTFEVKKPISRCGDTVIREVPVTVCTISKSTAPLTSLSISYEEELMSTGEVHKHFNDKHHMGDARKFSLVKAIQGTQLNKDVRELIWDAMLSNGLI